MPSDDFSEMCYINKYLISKVHQGQNVSKKKVVLFFTSFDRARRTDSEYVSFLCFDQVLGLKRRKY